jgi:hypothetical protein
MRPKPRSTYGNGCVVEIMKTREGRILTRHKRNPSALPSPWIPFRDIEGALVDVSLELGEAGILVTREADVPFVCPECGAVSPASCAPNCMIPGVE